MDKYTIVIPGSNEPNVNYKTFDEVIKESKKLCKEDIPHIIRDNEFNISVKMGYGC